MKDNKEKNKGGENIFSRLKQAGCSFSSLFWLIAAIAFAYWMFHTLIANRDVSTISYSEFRQQVQNGNVTQITVRGEKISGTFESPVKQWNGKQSVYQKEFTTAVPSFGDNS